MAFISAAAAAGATPAFIRAMTDQLCAVRRSPPCSRSAGIQTSMPPGNVKLSGMTPTTRASRSPMRSVRPGRSGSEDSVRSQKRRLTMAAAAPFARSSSGTKLRPIAGDAPNTLKKPSVTKHISAKRGSLPPRTVPVSHP